jgi:hypothetical protein
MSYEYEKLNKNDLYSLLGKIRKENKWNTNLLRKR